MEYSTIEPWQGVDENGVVYELGSLLDYFQRLCDPRKARGKRYSLVTLLVLIFLAKLSGMDSPSAIADWCQARREALIGLLGLCYGRMPSHSTFRRVFADVLEEAAFEEHMRAYTVQQRGVQPDARLRVIDGKKQRGTIPPGETQGEATMAVYDPERQEVLAQVAIDPGEGEIPTAQKLLGQVDLQGTVVLADALHAQRKLCQQVGRAGGNYVLIVKENQPTLYQAIELLVTQAQPHPRLLDFQTVDTTNKGHGRLEQRTLTAVSVLPGEMIGPISPKSFASKTALLFYGAVR